MDPLFSYRKLRVYQYAREYNKCVYLLLKKFPKEENYALCDQLRRSSTSILSNLAEGSGRKSNKEKLHFIEIAFGSLTESMCQMEIAFDLGYIDADDLTHLEMYVTEISKMLSGLHNSYET